MPPPAEVQDSTLVGRAAELAALAVRMDAAASGSGGVALLAGEPGIGKTRLAQESMRLAEQRGLRALWGRCFEGEGAPAFWPWLQVLRALSAGRDIDALRAVLGPAARDLSALIPDLIDREPPRFEAPEERFRLFESVAAFLRLAARGDLPPPDPRPAGAAPHRLARRGREQQRCDERGLLLVLDDLHWADAPTLLLLEFVAKQLEQTPILIIGSYRDMEVHEGHPLARTLGVLARLPGALHRGLRGFDEGDVGRLAAQIAGGRLDPRVVAAIRDGTDGNPFFVTEMVRHLAREDRLDDGAIVGDGRLPLPAAVGEVIGLRLQRLSEPCRRALTLAAVLGREFSVTALELAGAGGDMLDLLEEAEAAHLIEMTEGALDLFRFTHALVRETLYDAIPRVRRARLHRQAAIGLEQHWGHDADRSAELAWHFLQAVPAGEAARATEHSRRAGAHAFERLAWEEAVSHYQRALETLSLVPAPDDRERGDLLLVLGAAQRCAGLTEAAKATHLEALALARAAGLDHLRARAVLGYSDTCEVRDAPLPWEELLKEGLAAAGAEDSALHVQLSPIWVR